MSDLPEEDGPQTQPAGSPSPGLQDFRDAFTHPEAEDWSQEVTTRLNDYFQRRQIADDNQKAGQNFVNDIDQFKSGLVSMVQSDPNAVHVALDIVHPTMAGIIGNMPGAPDDAEDHHASLTGHIQSEIASAAVTEAAFRHEDLANGMLDNPRIADILGDQVGPLRTYTAMQAAARARDNEAQAAHAEGAKLELADNSARNYLGALIDPNNGTPRSPPGWNQAVMADDRVPPQLKVDLFDAHERLGINGDARSNPLAAMDMVGRIAGGTAKQRDLYPMIGDSLSMADASTLVGLMQNPTRAKQLNETLQAANRYYAPNGDIAETRAMARFVDWLLPQVSQGAVLDPRNKDWVLGGPEGAEGFMNTFRVRGDDLLDRATAPYDVLSRPALGDIFGVPARNRVQKTGVGDGPIQPLPILPGSVQGPPGSGQAPIGGTESGGFFQRKVRELPPGTKAS